MGDERYPARDRLSSEPTADKVSERDAKIWQTIADCYGARWNKSYGDLPPRTWCQLFKSLTNQQVAQAIPKLTEHYPHHPPTLGEFIEVARLGIARAPALRDPVDDMSHYATGANKVMMAIVKEKNGVSDYVLDKLLNEKRRVVNQYEVMAADKEIKVDWKEFINVMDDRLRAVITEAKSP